MEFLITIGVLFVINGVLVIVYGVLVKINEVCHNKNWFGIKKGV